MPRDKAEHRDKDIPGVKEAHVAVVTAIKDEFRDNENT